MYRRWLGRNSRFAVPVVLAAVAGVAAATVAASASAAPQLPRRSAAQLLASAERARLPGAFTATISETAALGIPDLPAAGGVSSPASLLSGTHTLSIWYAGPRHLRIAAPVPFGENDLRVNGSQVWLWDSRRQTATHVVGLPPRARGWAKGAARRDEPAGPDGRALTPLALARRLLGAVSPTTAVSVGSDVTVAGRAAYQLVIAPRTTRSLIGQVRIAVDAARGLPLQVAIYPRGAASPAFETGFTALSLGPPAAGNFRFRPPPGATVRSWRLPTPGMTWPGPPLSDARPWAGPPPVRGSHLRAAGVRVLGSGWLSVLVLPGGGAGPASGAAWESGGAAGSGSAAYSSTLTLRVRSGSGRVLPPAMLRAAVPVHGSWGSGRLLRTALFTVLVTSKGPVLAGAVTPGVLYAGAARLK